MSVEMKAANSGAAVIQILDGGASTPSARQADGTSMNPEKAYKKVRPYRFV
jgi:hypothetical protein